MEKLTKLQSFMFDKAQYEIIDTLGNRGLLKVDYKNNKYKVIGIKDRDSIQKVFLFAQSILAKKHGVNFANM